MRELSLNIMDIAQNSVSAGASLITIHVEEQGERLSIEILDNGKGMSQEQVLHVTDPFYTTRTTRKVGLGIPLFQMQAELTGGGLTISSKEGEGTAVRAWFISSHVDMIPLGDINATMVLLITCNPDRDFVYVRGRDGRQFTLDTRELRPILGEEVPLNTPDVTDWIREYLQEQTDLLRKDENV